MPLGRFARVYGLKCRPAGGAPDLGSAFVAGRQGVLDGHKKLAVPARGGQT